MKRRDFLGGGFDRSRCYSSPLYAETVAEVPLSKVIVKSERRVEDERYSFGPENFRPLRCPKGSGYGINILTPLRITANLKIRSRSHGQDPKGQGHHYVEILPSAALSRSSTSWFQEGDYIVQSKEAV